MVLLKQHFISIYLFLSFWMWHWLTITFTRLLQIMLHILFCQLYFLHSNILQEFCAQWSANFYFFGLAIVQDSKSELVWILKASIYSLYTWCRWKTTLSPLNRKLRCGPDVGKMTRSFFYHLSWVIIILLEKKYQHQTKKYWFILIICWPRKLRDTANKIIVQRLPKHAANFLHFLMD